MPQQNAQSAETNFSQGYKTEFTGLNFPENSATDALNCVFSHLGNVTRRPAIDYETHFALSTITRTNQAVTTYKWNNAGGDGLTQIVVLQVGGTLYFYRSSSATSTSPLSTTQLVSTIVFQGLGTTEECQFTDGNGYLFVFHPNTDPQYCTYSAGTVTAQVIPIKIRDVGGILELGVKDQDRPSTLSSEHGYNLVNQGWSSAPSWSASSTSTVTIATGSRTFTATTGLTTTPGQIVQVNGIGLRGSDAALNGSLTSYNSGTGVMVINVTSITNTTTSSTYNNWVLYPFNAGLINAWSTAEGNYPSNADVWWRFKNSSGTFDPATTQPSVDLSSGPAPKGSFILDAFNQKRTVVSSIPGLTDVVATTRPRTGTWFQGRLWYAGVDASQAATGDQQYYTWTENIYFSQTVLNSNQFGSCHQQNDPTSETLFDLLPTDGGVINIQGCGSVYKLFPIQNGILVFAANGIWYITGSQGLGFAANDYTIPKISSIQSISGSSFVDVQGLPMWWNEEGIYTVSVNNNNNVSYGPSRGALGNGGLTVEPLTYSTIQTFFQDIPLNSKKYVKAVYDPLNWEVKWLYKTAEETDVTSRYQFDGILMLNTTTRAFSPWTIETATTHPSINGLVYVQGPGGSTSPTPAIKYVTSLGTSFTFADERDTQYADWTATSPINFASYFVSGFKLIGGGLHKFQPTYVNVFVNNDVNTSYKIQGVWDYALNRSTGKFTSIQKVETLESPEYFGVLMRRHKVRGRGIVLQFKVTAVDDAPFDILGWSVDQKVNTNT